MPARNSNKQTPSRHLTRQVSRYSLAAAAAGVGVLALAAPAEGEVVVTQKTIPIPLSSLGVNGVGISFANNGVDDLKLVLSSFSVFGANGNRLKAADDAEGEGVLGHAPDGYREASALTPGKEIGPSAHFVSAACKGIIFFHLRCAGTGGNPHQHLRFKRGWGTVGWKSQDCLPRRPLPDRWRNSLRLGSLDREHRVPAQDDRNCNRLRIRDGCEPADYGRASSGGIVSRSAFAGGCQERASALARNARIRSGWTCALAAGRGR